LKFQTRVTLADLFYQGAAIGESVRESAGLSQQFEDLPGLISKGFSAK